MTLRLVAANPTDADVAIVGAGPAGAAAACHFARTGFRVALIDQRRFPRDKVCGDFVGPAALAEINRLGLSSRTTFRDANPIRHGALFLNGDKVVRQRFPHTEGLCEYGLCIPRMLLDDAIVHAAVTSGARLLEEARVIGYETDTTGATLFYQERGGLKRLRARLLIGADGSSSLISRILRGAAPPKRNRIVAVRAYFDGIEGPIDQADLYVNSSSFPGYCWLFPVGGNTANVGIGIPLEAWSGTNKPLIQLLTELVKSDPAINSRLRKAKMCGKVVGWPLATFNPKLPIIANRVGLLGDAAGLINPLSGEGIQYALKSARWSAEELRGALCTDSLSAGGLRPYANRVQGEIRYDMALARFIIDLAKNRSFRPLWLWALAVIAERAASDPGYYDVAAGVFGGVVPARELLAPHFVWCTLKSAAATRWAAGVHTLHWTRHEIGNGTTLIGTMVSMFRDSARHPFSTFGWAVDCALSVFELAKQIAISS